jgi:hypothetical protein
MAVSTATHGAKVHSHRVRNLKLDQKSTMKVGGRTKRCLMVYNFRSMNVRCKIEQNVYYRTRKRCVSLFAKHAHVSGISDKSFDSVIYIRLVLG